MNASEWLCERESESGWSLRREGGVASWRGIVLSLPEAARPLGVAGV